MSLIIRVFVYIFYEVCIESYVLMNIYYLFTVKQKDINFNAFKDFVCMHNVLD